MKIVPPNKKPCVHMGGVKDRVERLTGCRGTVGAVTLPETRIGKEALDDQVGWSWGERFLRREEAISK